MRKTLYDFPAYKLVEPLTGFGACLRDGDVIALPYQTKFQERPLFRFFTMGSVVGYAMRYGECPERQLAQARERGHDLWWANQNATVLTAEKRPQETRPLYQWGDVVRFHGRSFRLDPAPNGNCKLTLIEDVATEGKAA